MTYAKRPKACQDFFVGINEVNGAIANAAAVHDALSAEHVLGTLDGGTTSGAAPLEPGRHNDVEIPRAVVLVAISTYSFQGATTTSASVNLTGRPYVTSVEQVATGLWFVETNYLADGAWAEASAPVSSSSDVRVPYAHWQGNFQNRTGFLVHTLTQGSSGAAFTAADSSFCLRIFSR